MSLIEKIDEQIKALRKFKDKVQADCCHPVTAVTRKRAYIREFGSDYAPLKESGTDCECQLCKKTWHEKGELPSEPKKKAGKP